MLKQKEKKLTVERRLNIEDVYIVDELWEAFHRSLQPRGTPNEFG